MKRLSFRELCTSPPTIVFLVLHGILFGAGAAYFDIVAFVVQGAGLPGIVLMFIVTILYGLATISSSKRRRGWIVAVLLAIMYLALCKITHSLYWLMFQEDFLSSFEMDIPPYTEKH